MSKKMLVNAAQADEVRVVIIQNGVMEDLNVSMAGNEQLRGNVYKARVVNIETSLQAAFIDFGIGRNGFITLNDIHPRFYNRRYTGKARPRIQDVLRNGAELIVQVYKEEMGNKGAALTCDITLPGRYLVLGPYSRGGGVSRKIEDEGVRKRLKELISKMNTTEEMNLIVRTAGEGCGLGELQQDYQQLLRLWGHIQARAARLSGPGLLYAEPDVVIRSVRDYFSDDMDEVLTDDPSTHQKILSFFEERMGGDVKKVKLYSGKMPIFSNFGLEQQFENISSPTVPLKSGGSIVINPTEALTAIDVNSGRSRNHGNQDRMALAINKEAAGEVARQLRLRDIGGLVVVDFIDMQDPKSRREVEQVLGDCMKMDKAQVELGRISRFGLLELSRQRIKGRLLSSTHQSCPLCKGSGWVMNSEVAGMSMLRRLQELAVSAPRGAKIKGRLSTEVALYLLNQQRGKLASLEEEFSVQFDIIPDSQATHSRDAFQVNLENVIRLPREERSSRRRPSRRSESRPTRRSQEESCEPPKVVGFIPPEQLAAAELGPPQLKPTGVLVVVESEPEQISEEPKQRRRRRRRKPEEEQQLEPQELSSESPKENIEEPSPSVSAPKPQDAAALKREAARARNRARRERLQGVAKEQPKVQKQAESRNLSLDVSEPNTKVSEPSTTAQQQSQPKASPKQPSTPRASSEKQRSHRAADRVRRRLKGVETAESPTAPQATERPALQRKRSGRPAAPQATERPALQRKRSGRLAERLKARVAQVEQEATPPKTLPEASETLPSPKPAPKRERSKRTAPLRRSGPKKPGPKKPGPKKPEPKKPEPSQKKERTQTHRSRRGAQKPGKDLEAAREAAASIFSTL